MVWSLVTCKNTPVQWHSIYFENKEYLSFWRWHPPQSTYWCLVVEWPLQVCDSSSLVSHARSAGPVNACRLPSKAVSPETVRAICWAFLGWAVFNQAYKLCSGYKLPRRLWRPNSTLHNIGNICMTCNEPRADVKLAACGYGWYIFYTRTSGSCQYF